VLPQPAVSHIHTPTRESVAYQRRQPETTLLCRTLQAHWLPFLAEIEAEGGELPAFVRDEIEAYFRCGILAHGFVRVRCKDCGHNRVVAFACKRRGFCPSCLGRRMADTAVFCVDHISPRVPVRQLVLTVPLRLRFQMAYSPQLAGAVLRAVIAAITGDLRRRARKCGIRGRLRTGAFTVVQRFGSALGLNVHFHTLALDGVYARQPDGGLLFHPLPAPSDEDVARVARAVCRKVHRLLVRQKDAADDQTSLLDELANASVQGLVATGPRRGCRVLRLGRSGDDADAAIPSKRCAEVAGFNVHANTSARANDRKRLEHLVKYLARPPIAHDRLTELPDGRIALRFKQAWRDGTASCDLEPLALLARLAALVPPPRRHLTLYCGVLSSHARLRSQVVPQAPTEATATEQPQNPARKSKHIPWAELLPRTFAIGIKCGKCGSSLASYLGVSFMTVPSL
jgi:hypothetical protein